MNRAVWLPDPLELEDIKRPRRRPLGILARTIQIAVLAILLAVIAAVVFLVLEFRSNANQARILADFTSLIGYSVRPGADDDFPPPDQGPYDIRLGYATLPRTQARLQDSGFAVQSQSRLSRRHEELAKLGLYRIYDEKPQAGLELLDQREETLHRAHYPRRIYTAFEEIPALVLTAMSFVEDRELLDFSKPYRNPVVDWERLGKAVILQGLKSAGLSERAIGGSTVATQLEKLRHSPGGVTRDAGDKLTQMLSAVMRVYRGGADTLGARRKLAVDYLNSLPLAARRGFGEVNSLGDGLEVWYGSDFREVNAVLSDTGAPIDQRARYFKQVLSLVLAIRRPAYYLSAERNALDDLTDSYLRVMMAEGVISPALAEAALAQSLQETIRQSPPRETVDFRTQKGVNLLRNRLLWLLDADNYYQLDRFDVTAWSTLNREVQSEVTQFLSQLGSPERIAALGLTGDRLLSASDPSKVIYSFTLYESDVTGNKLRVNADNLDQPFDVNAGAKLDLGSTAKLRTLITWLELTANAFERLRGLDADDESMDIHARDKLGRWVRDYLRQNPGSDVDALLRAAMAREFSASPAASFYTGGGVHTFANFEKSDNFRTMTVSEAMRRSVNLVFIRMMREVVDHHIYAEPGSLARVLENPDDPERMQYLQRFADREGAQYLTRFYRKYAGKSSEEALETLLEGNRLSPRSLTVILRSLGVTRTPQELAEWLSLHAPVPELTTSEVETLFDKYDPARWNLNDRGYLARIHPLELWLLEYLAANPGATRSEAIAASTDVRQEVYRWLMKTKRRHAQDRRILDLLEIDAFQEIHQSWARLGYPFASLTPSLATAIGSSGDRPAALAELMGILVAGGLRRDTVLYEQIDFGLGTPYETRFTREPPPAQQVLRPDVAAIVNASLRDVVENGTARSLVPALAAGDGARHFAGGKTGTGDHRFEVFAAPGVLLESRVVNRVATFVFQIDERFFGTITAYVSGPEAANYKFTSGLPVRLLGAMMPLLSPLMDNPGQYAVSAVEPDQSR